MRRYNFWAGNPKGTPESPKRCIAEVYDSGRGGLFYQCIYKRGKGPGGLYCGYHAWRLSKGQHVDVGHEEKGKA